MGTVALLISDNRLVETLTDSGEIDLVKQIEKDTNLEDVLKLVKHYRQANRALEERVGDQVEEILVSLSSPPEAKFHAMEWMKSALKMESFRKDEYSAAQTIGQFAYDVYKKQPELTDFVLQAEKAQVRVLIFSLQRSTQAA